MRKTLQQLGRMASLFVLGSTISFAQDNGFDAQLKFRVGSQFGEKRDNLDQKTLGFGLDLGYNLAFGRLGVEVGWFYKPGKQYRPSLDGIEIASGATLDAAKSAETRRNEIQGTLARLSYQKSYGDFGLNAGLQMGKQKFRHEYIGEVNGTTGGKAYKDVYNGTPAKSEFAVSPYVGGSYKLNDFSSVELNVLALRYTAVNYVHVAGVAAGLNQGIAQDRLVESKRTVPHIELGYVIRF